MANTTVVEIKAFVPAKDFDLSKRFYRILGFQSAWSNEQFAYLTYGDISFFLQNFYVKEHAENFMMHLLVEDVNAWWRKVVESEVENKFDVKMTEPEDQPWKMREFVLIDPSGVLWRIGQSI